MKLSKETIEVLTNFASINPGLVFQAGSVLKTIHQQKTIMATAKISESIPQEFAVYDLGEFLNAINAFEDTELEFQEKLVVLGNDVAKVYYTYANAETIVKPPSKAIKLPSAEVAFVLEDKALRSALKMAGVLKMPNVALVGRDGVSYISAIDTAKDDSKRFEYKVGEAKKDYRMVFRVENLKLLPRDYDVEVTSKGVSFFKSKSGDVEYFIATETTGSSYGKDAA